MTYVPGDYWVICDRCGFKKRKSETSMTWDNLLVCTDKCFEEQHPQDFVKARVDIQSVPIARPDVDFILKTLPLRYATAIGGRYIYPDPYTSITVGSSIGITLDDGTVFWTYVSALIDVGGLREGLLQEDGEAILLESGETLLMEGLFPVLIADPLYGPASDGNLVYLPGGGNSFFLTEAVTANDL